MLQLQTKNLDIGRISKMLVKHKIKASITNQVITLEGNIPDSLLTDLCSEINFNTIQNYKEEVESKESNKVIPIPSRELKSDEQHETNIFLTEMQQYDLLFPEVKNGEIYWCDFGEPYGSETGYKRPAVVIKNDFFETKKSKCTIVVPCSTADARVSSDYNITFDETNVADFDRKRFGRKGCSGKIMCGDIRTVNKKQLRQYIGILKPEVMEKIKPILAGVLQITEDSAKQERRTDSINMNLIQTKMLTLVNINELIKISESNATKDAKILSILDLFGFDSQKKGFKYLTDVISASLNNDQFNLSTLCESVSNDVGIEKEEIMRLVVARVKERFCSISKKAPTIDFIRLIKTFLI